MVVKSLCCSYGLPYCGWLPPSETIPKPFQANAPWPLVPSDLHPVAVQVLNSGDVLMIPLLKLPHGSTKLAKLARSMPMSKLRTVTLRPRIDDLKRNAFHLLDIAEFRHLVGTPILVWFMSAIFSHLHMFMHCSLVIRQTVPIISRVFSHFLSFWAPSKQAIQVKVQSTANYWCLVVSVFSNPRNRISDRFDPFSRNRTGFINRGSSTGSSSSRAL